MKYIIIKNKIVSLFLNALIFLFLLIFLSSIQKNVFKKSLITNNTINAKRILFSGIENKKTEEICGKAVHDLLSLYEKDIFDDINTNITMKKSTSYLYQYLEDNKDNYLKKYILSFIFEITLVIFIFLIIIIWIVLHCFLTNNKICCLSKNKKHNNWIKNIALCISVSLYLIIILLNIIFLFKFYSFIQILNNSFCSLFKIPYHTYLGEEKNYQIRPKWIGINEIKDIIQQTKYQIDDIADKKKEIFNLLTHDIKNDFYSDLNDDEFLENHIKKFCDLSKFKVPNPNPLSDKKISNFYFCSEILNLIQNEFNNNNISKYIIDIDEIYEKMNSIDSYKNEMKFSLDNAKNKLDSFIKIISDLEIEYFDTLYFISDDIINKYFIIFFYIFFILILLIEGFGLISIISNVFCSNSNYCYKLYMFTWNTQMIIIILVLLISILFSISNVIVQDISIIIKYSLYNENINLNKTFSISNVQYDIEGIDACINEGGNLEHYTQLDESSESLIHFYSYINLIKDNLNYLINYKIYVEKNEASIKFDELEEKPFLSKYQLDDTNISLNNGIYFSPQSILENVLNKYTNNDNKNIQNIGNNTYFSNYMFVHSKEFCKSDYDFVNIDFSINNNPYYEKGKKCMLIKDFPDNDYFKGINLKYLRDDKENLIDDNNLYDLNNLTKEFKKRYYDNDNGFKSSFENFLSNSKNYYNNIIEPNYKNIKDTLIKIFQIVDDKINVINELYENIIGKNNTNLFSIFNCKYLKRDINIFLNQIDLDLSHSFFILSVYNLLIGIFSLLCIIISIFVLKLNKMIKNNYTLTSKNKNEIDDNDINFSEKPKIEENPEKYDYDEAIKTSFNEKIGFSKKTKKIQNDNKE